MGVKSQELNLDLSSDFVPKTISDILTEVSVMGDVSMKLTKLNDCIHVLEDESRKIDAFKRELPLCVALMNDAIERLKEETLLCEEKQVRPALEEFLPLKCNSDDNGGAKMSRDFSDKKNWMSSAQLWSTPVQYDCDIKKKDSILDSDSREKEEDDDGSAAEKPFQLCNFGNGGGAFVPFHKPSTPAINKYGEGLPVRGLSLSILAAELEPVDLNFKENNSSQSKCSQQQRKQRRCWSPELHRRFVSALQQLGGAQVATPKQIRELMQVDGLTNDEVKSHLQKYRLHVRKLPASSSAGAPPSSRKYQSSSGSPEGPLHLNRSAKGGGGGGESMEEEDEEEEEDDDEKSESNSWKARLLRPIEGHV